MRSPTFYHPYLLIFILRMKFKPQKQIGGTFYAHAATALLHLAMHRIIGCAGKPSYPTFEDPKNEMLKKYGTCGKNIEEVVKQVCFK